MHARCLLCMQSAEMERRKCVKAGPYQLGTPHSPAAVDNPQDCASRDTQRQAGGCSPQPRLVWTPELDQRFVEAVEQLGPKIATPKTILQVVSHPLLLLSLPSSYTQQHFTCPPTKQEIHLIKPPWTVLLQSDSMDRRRQADLLRSARQPPTRHADNECGGSDAAAGKDPPRGLTDAAEA